MTTFDEWWDTDSRAVNGKAEVGWSDGGADSLRDLAKHAWTASRNAAIEEATEIVEDCDYETCGYDGCSNQIPDLSETIHKLAALKEKT